MQVPARRDGRRRGPVVEVAPLPAVALHVHGDGCADVDRRVATQVTVEPGEGGVERTFSPAVEVPAAADAHPHGRAPGAQRDVVVAHAGERRVEPAVDQQRRHRPPVQQLLEANRRPVRIVGRRVRELLLVERVVLPRHVHERVAEGEVLVRAHEHLLLALDALRRDVLREATALGMEERERAQIPADHQLERERATEVPARRPRRERDDHGVEVRGRGRRERPLREAHVARPVGAEVARPPRLRGDPVGGRAAVVALGEEGL